jgi:hypothetical protein
MEAQANKKRKNCTFTPGDLVLLRLQPYRQQTVQRRTSQKLSKRFFGPFAVIRRIGAVAYELDLPASSRIHPVFHVSQLRAYHGSDPSSHFSPIPPELEDYIILDRDEVHDSVLGSNEQEVESSKSLMQGNNTSTKREQVSMSWEQEGSNDLEKNNPAAVKEGTDVLDTPLDIVSEELVPRTDPSPLDPFVTSQVFPLPLVDCVASKNLPRGSATPSPPLIIPNGPFPTLSHGPHVFPSQLDASVNGLENPSITCPHMCSPKAIFPPFPTSSPPYITTTCTPSLITNLEDKVFFGPDSNVSGQGFLWANLHFIFMDQFYLCFYVIVI